MIGLLEFHCSNSWYFLATCKQLGCTSTLLTHGCIIARQANLVSTFLKIFCVYLQIKCFILLVSLEKLVVQYRQVILVRFINFLVKSNLKNLKLSARFMTMKEHAKTDQKDIFIGSKYGGHTIILIGILSLLQVCSKFNIL